MPVVLKMYIVVCFCGNEIEDKVRLRFNLKHPDTTGNGTFVVEVYSPYWIINEAGFEFEILACGKSLSTAGSRHGDSRFIRKFENIPFLFGFSTHQSSKFLALKTGELDWSKPFNVDTPGTSGVIRIQKKVEEITEFMDVTCIISTSYSTPLSKVLTFKARYILVNKTHIPLYLKQGYISESMVTDILPEEEKDFFWTDMKVVESKRHCCVSFDKTNWSPPFSIHTAGSLVIKILIGNDIYVLRVEVKISQSSLYAVFYLDYSIAPFYLENRTKDVTISFRQKNEEKHYILPPGCVKPYCYDCILSPHVFVWQSVSGTEVCENDCVIKEPYFYELKTHNDNADPVTVYCLVLADGLSRILVFHDDLSVVRQIIGNVYGLGSERLSSDLGSMSVASLKFRLHLAGVGVSLVNRVPEELLYLSMTDINFVYEYMELVSTMSCKVGNVQVDNQLLSTGFPVMLYRTPDEGQSLPESERKAFVDVVVVKLNNRGNEDFPVETYKYFSVCFQMLSVKLDEQLAI